ncbi:MAG TPA: 50S ribosomal protein L18 [Polyangia bacterium]
MSRKTKLESRTKRHNSLRKRIEGTAERPRLVVFRSARHIYAQVINDLERKTLIAASDLAKKADRPAAGTKQPKKSDRAKDVGMRLAKLCLEKGISKVVFDRAGYKYHGRVSAVAAGAREGGLDF